MVHVVILAAGMGTRLARPHPKSMTQLSDGRTIIKQQLSNLKLAFGKKLRVSVVVGYKMDQLMEHVPDVSFVYNENFDVTNTSKSLLKALRTSPKGGVLWLNGDVVFDPQVLEYLAPLIKKDVSFVAVDTSTVSQEEVKYTVDDGGSLAALSKQVPQAEALGEAVGINYVSKADKKKLIKRLAQTDDQDYFERGIELTIAKDGARWTPVNISQFYAVEVDFQEDLAAANEFLNRDK